MLFFLEMGSIKIRFAFLSQGGLRSGVEMEYVYSKARIRWSVGVRGTLDADRGASFLQP